MKKDCNLWSFLFKKLFILYMTIQELHKTIEDELSNDLNGQFNFDGEVLKWEYDGIEYLHDSLEEHLDIVSHEDKEIIEDFLTDYDEFVVSEPEIHETFAYFYIEK